MWSLVDHIRVYPKEGATSSRSAVVSQPCPLSCDTHPGHTPQVDKFPSLALGEFGVAVDSERSLRASPIARVEADHHPDLADPRALREGDSYEFSTRIAA